MILIIFIILPMIHDIIGMLTTRINVLIYIREGGMPKSSKPAEDFHAPATIVLS